MSKSSNLWSEARDAADEAVCVLRRAGIVIVAEADAVRSPARLMSAHPQTIQLDEGALAVSTGNSDGPFAVLTRDAVYSAQQADWGLCSEGGRTSAVVWSGIVIAELRLDGAQRALGAGYTDVGDADNERMERLSNALQRSRRTNNP